MTRKTPCKRSDLISFIQAYSVASKTENPILMGLSGDALNRMLDTLTFQEDVAEKPSPVQEVVPNLAPLPRKRPAKKDSDDDF
jgi:hypothetical protein